MARQMRGITLKIEEEATKELHNQRELIRTTTRDLKERDLKVFATIAGRRVTCPRIVGLGKSFSKAMWHPPRSPTISKAWRNEMQRKYVT